MSVRNWEGAELELADRPTECSIPIDTRAGGQVLRLTSDQGERGGWLANDSTTDAALIKWQFSPWNSCHKVAEHFCCRWTSNSFFCNVKMILYALIGVGFMTFQCSNFEANLFPAYTRKRIHAYTERLHYRPLCMLLSAFNCDGWSARCIFEKSRNIRIRYCEAWTVMVDA